MTNTPTILFLGCGNMGAAILTGALAAMPEARFIALVRNPDRARTLLPRNAPVRIITEIEALDGIRPDITVVAVKPQQFDNLPLDDYAMLFGGVTVSIMAGTTAVDFAEGIGSKRVARVMPNLAAAVGQSQSLGYAVPGVLTTEDRELVDRLFGAVGAVEWMESEEMFDFATAIAGCGPGYLFAFAQHLVEAGIAGGLAPDTADRLVRQTIFGSAIYLDRDEQSAEDLKKAVASPGGVTQRGLDVLEAPDAFPKILPAAVDAAYRRNRELGGND